MTSCTKDRKATILKMTLRAAGNGNALQGLDGSMRIKHGNPLFPVMSGWDLLLTDPNDSRVVCYVFRNNMDKARSFRRAASHPCRVVCVVSEPPKPDVLAQADQDGVEVWFDYGDVRILSEQLEFAATAPIQRVRPDEAENVDLDLLHVLQRVSAKSNAGKLLAEARTLEAIARMDQVNLTRIAGSDEIYRFFNQTL